MAGVRFVGNDADRACLGTRAVERTLRPGEGLDALDVIHVQIDRTENRRDGLFIQIRTDARQRGRMVRIVAGRDAAHEHPVVPRAQHLHRGAGQQFHIVVEALNMLLLEFFGSEHGDADRYILQIFGMLLGGYDDLLQSASLRSFLRIRRWHRSKKCRWQGHARQYRAGALELSQFASGHEFPLQSRPETNKSPSRDRFRTSAPLDSSPARTRARP